MGCRQSKKVVYAPTRGVRTPSVRIREAKAKVPPNSIRPIDEELSAATGDGDLDRVRKAVADGADVNSRVMAQSPLMMAARYGHAGLVSVLVEAGADLDARDKVERTALIIAARYGHDDVVRALVAADAPLDATDAYGRTAAMTASMCGEEPTATLSILLEAGANMELEDVYGKTVMTLAREGSHWDIVSTLSTSKLSPYFQSRALGSSAMPADGPAPPIAAVMSDSRPSEHEHESKMEPLVMSEIVDGSRLKTPAARADTTPALVSRMSSEDVSSLTKSSSHRSNKSGSTAGSMGTVVE